MALRVHDAFGNSLAVEARHLVKIDVVLQQQRSAWSDAQRVELVTDRCTSRHRQTRRTLANTHEHHQSTSSGAPCQVFRIELRGQRA